MSDGDFLYLYWYFMTYFYHQNKNNPCAAFI